jgi:hypothetical protein
MDIETGCEGFKITLNTTEFLFPSAPIKHLLEKYNAAQVCLAINSNTPYSLENTYPTNLTEFIAALKQPSLRYGKNDRPGDSGCRYLHNYPNGQYNAGRHSTRLPTTATEEFQIIWLGYFPWNEHLEKRKLQIKNNIPQSDKDCGAGGQHLYPIEVMKAQLNERFSRNRTLNESNPILLSILNNI